VSSDTSSPPRRRLGRNGPLVSAIGYGAMGLSGVYGAADDAESARLLDQMLDDGLNFLDTADVYGQGHNEKLIRGLLVKRRDEVVLATKFGADKDTGGGRPAYVRQAVDASLSRLGIDRIDLYYLHRVDRSTPIEDTVGTMAELVAEGKIGHIGLSEISAETLRRAHAVHSITAVQQEYSLFTRDPEEALLPTMRELGVSLVAYSPLGRGVLTGTFSEVSDVENLAERAQRYPRFEAESLQHNIELTRPLREHAQRLGLTPAQLALAWLLAQGEDIVPIPGSRRIERVRDNIRASTVELDSALVAELSERFPPGAAVGERYHPSGMARLDQ
jgi:aryl-alcohol dehydrogenase-like predicted oxidoreductase